MSTRSVDELICELSNPTLANREHAKQELFERGPSVALVLLRAIPELKAKSYKASHLIPAGHEYSASSLLTLAAQDIGKIIASHRRAVVPSLVEQFRNSTEPTLGRYAADVLKIIGKAALPEMVLCLSDECAYVRELALDVLARMGKGSGAVQSEVRELVDDPSINVQRAAVDALPDILQAPDALPILARAVRHSDSVVRQKALEGIALFKEASISVLSEIVTALDDPECYVYAALAISGIGKAANRAIPNLIQAMRHECFEHHQNLHDAFHLIGLDSVWPLALALKDPDCRVRDGAKHALRDLATYGPDIGIIETLVTRIRNGTANDQCVALIALGAIGRKAAPALPIIREFSTQGPMHLRGVAASSLELVERLLL